MLFVKFEMGGEHYVLDAMQIAEVLPLIGLKRLPQAPVGVAGLFNYRGTPVPVVDLAELMLGHPAAKLLSTRVILVHYRDDAQHEGERRLLGLIVEKATETLQRDPADFMEAGILSTDAPYLGPVTREGERLIQRVDVHKLLPEAVSSVLYAQVEEESWSLHASKRS